MSRTMTTSALATLVAACLVVTSQAQGLSDAQVADAIKAGQSKKFDHLVSECDAKGGLVKAYALGLSAESNRPATTT